MSIDFEIPAEAKAIREKVRKWVHEECIPAEKELATKPLPEVLGPLRAKARVACAGAISIPTARWRRPRASPSKPADVPARVRRVTPHAHPPVGRKDLP